MVIFALMYLSQAKQIIKQNQAFYLLYLMFFILGFSWYLMHGSFAVSLFLNGLNNTLADYFFSYVTHLGDGYFAVAVGVMILTFNRTYFWVMVGCLSTPALITQFLKRVVFSDKFRPSVLMKDVPNLHYVNGVDIHEQFSFPSGHSTSAFAVFLFLALISQQKKWGKWFFAVAAIAALSRVYLLQHFIEDVLIGSAIAVFFCTLVYTIFAAHANKTQ